MANFINEIQMKFDEKVTVKDLVLLLDQKSNIDDINRLFSDFSHRLDLKTSLKSFEDEMRKQDEINSTLCSELCIGRWLWESGKLKNGGLSIPWEQQTVNTCVENFQWDPSDNAHIVLAAPGLYEF